MRPTGRIVACAIVSIALLVACSDEIFYESESTGSVVGKVVQNDAGAKATISQGVPVDSALVDPANGMFGFDELAMGNYVLKVEAPTFSVYTTPVFVDGGRTTYVGEISLSKVPAMVSAHFPKDRSERVLLKEDNTSNLFVSVQFSTEMDRQSLQDALSISPIVDGSFYWNLYTESMYRGSPGVFAGLDAGGGSSSEGAEITTYTHVSAFTFWFSPKDSFPDTTYHIALSTAAYDTAGTPLEIPLAFSFSTIQASVSQQQILTDPYDGQLNVSPIRPDGIQVSFPRRMDQDAVAQALVISPDTDAILIWPEGNLLTVWTGGLLVADTTYTIAIGGEALDLDGVPLGEDFAFSFTTQPVEVVATDPRQGELFVDTQPTIVMHFSSWMALSSVEEAFHIEPEVAGTLSFVTEEIYYRGNKRTVLVKEEIQFVPSRKLAQNTEYTIMLDGAAVDALGRSLAPHSFSFITRPE